MKFALLSSLLISLVFVYSIIFFSKDLIINYSLKNPQCFHEGNIPRLGGLAMSLAILFLFSISIYLNVQKSLFEDFKKIFISILFINCFVFMGIAEDITQKIPVKIRFISTLFFSTMACWYSDIYVSRLDIPIIDVYWTNNYWPGLLLAIFAMGGLPHAFNIIDGYNGLAGVVAIVINLALLYVCTRIGANDLAILICSLIGVTLGFLVFNYPFGKIFAGDGGAYMWGGIISYICVDLVANYAEVSAWFPIALLAYPVTETIFSIYRKKIQGKSPGEADALHLHQLIYRRLSKNNALNLQYQGNIIVRRNYMTSPYLWVINLLATLPSMLFWNNRNALIISFVVFVVFYIYIYISLVRFKPIIGLSK